MERQEFIDGCPDSGVYYHGYDGDKERWEILDLTILMCPVDGHCEYFLNELIPDSDKYKSILIGPQRAALVLLEGLPAGLLKVVAIRMFKEFA